ncbi:MAG: response regulator transcription factor [Candidatus Obscuribacterales bacterium]|nr:response regulator transcription factor [Candidatus Obscuribacterales bacterium]
MARILIVEDDPDLCRQLEKLLKAEAYTVDAANDGASGLAMLKQYRYDVIVMDWNLPEMEGPEVVRRFRSAGGATPIIMLTAQSDISNKEHCFDAGVDDYLSKPFNSRELAIRLRALLRRAVVLPTNVISVGELKIDIDAHSAEFAGVSLKLQRLEFLLLEFLMRNVGKVFTVEIILERVWPADSEVSHETVRGYIKTLKKKLLSVTEKPAIRNLHGLGYKLDPMD